MAGYTRQAAANITTGSVIDADDFNDEYNQVQSAFNASTGHTHDGTAAEGAPIEKIGPSQDIVVTAATIRPKTNNTVDLGTSALKFKDVFVAGDTSLAGDLSVSGDLTATLAANSVGSSQIAANAVTASEIAAGSITAAKLAAGAVSASNIASGAITSTQLAADSVTASQIATNAVGASEIAAGAVGASELNVSGNGSNTQFLRSDGDGTFTWAVPTDTNTTYGAGNGLSLSGTTFAMSGSFTGNFTASGNVTAYSDERIKENVETIEGALDKVSQMRGVTFKYKSELNDGQRGTGVIAQEMQQVMPEVIEEGEYLSVAYGNIVGVLIESIKELKTQIEELKNGSSD